ncbi:unnamed protein product, partial [Laminaria digitata]
SAPLSAAGPKKSAAGSGQSDESTPVPTPKPTGVQEKDEHEHENIITAPEGTAKGTEPVAAQAKHKRNIITPESMEGTRGTGMPVDSRRGMMMMVIRVEVGGGDLALAGPVSVLSPAAAATSHARSPLLGSNARFPSAPSSRGD